MFFWLFTVGLGLSGWTLAQDMGGFAKKFNLTPRQIEYIIYHQKGSAERWARESGALKLQAGMRPFSELEAPGYLVVSDQFDFASKQVKETLARELPESVKLVVHAHEENTSTALATFGQWINPDRLQVVSVPRSRRGFWSRDGLPIPLVNSQGGTSTLSTKPVRVVDAIYYHYFEPDRLFAEWLGASLRVIDFFFEGGNFMVNAKGDCLTVDNRLSVEIPTDVFHAGYGCTRVVRLPHLKGIGHADESVKFVRNNVVLTDLDEYVSVLEGHGFEVRKLPRPAFAFENYVNSLIINSTVFVPIFHQDTDAQAIVVYEELGFRVVPIDTRTLSNEGLGSIHCITMTYPAEPTI